MDMNQAALEAIGYEQVTGDKPLTLNFYGCFLYTLSSFNIDSKDIYVRKHKKYELYIGSDALLVYKQAMGVDMFVGPGGPSDEDLAPYQDKLTMLIKPIKKLTKELRNYNVMRFEGVSLLYKAFDLYAQEFKSDFSPILNKCIFDFKANFYSKNKYQISLKLEMFDFYGVDPNGNIYTSQNFGFFINAGQLTVVKKIEELDSYFDKETSTALGETFISIYSQVESEIDPFKEYIVTYNAMESYIENSFLALRRKALDGHIELDDWARYAIITNATLSLEQKYYLVGKFFWDNYSSDMHKNLSRYIKIRNDLAHSKKNHPVIDCIGIKSFFFFILQFRSST